jgi:hypothetical protein
MSITRRSLLGLFAGGLAAPVVTTWAKAAEAARFVNSSGLKPGGFIWQPSLAPDGSVLIVGSMREQTVHVYRNGLEIGISTCRTAPRAPFGLFSIIDQHRDRSGRLNTSTGRLVWQAAAAHAEGLDGVDSKVPLLRVPDDFAALLSAVTEHGATVVIADERTATTVIEHNAGLFSSLPSDATARLVNDIGRRIRRSHETAGAPGTEASIVVSGHDRKAYLIRAGKIEATTTVEIANPQLDLGTHVYGLTGLAADASALRWLAFGLSRSASAPHIAREKASAVIERLRFPESTTAVAMAEALGRGSTLYITDAAVTRSTRSARVDFEIIASRAAPSVGEPVRPGRRARPGAHIVDAVPAAGAVHTRNPFEPY